MTVAAASPFSFAQPSPAVWPRGLRRLLAKVLFLHLDLWPWSLTSSPARMLSLAASESSEGRGGSSSDPESSSSVNSFQHASVMLREAVDLLQPALGKLFVDATLGGAGHTLALLEAGASVVGLDQDEDALEAAREKCAAYDDRFAAIQSNFRHLESLLQETGVGTVDGILADIGVSSFQLDTAERGFSFQKDGPLDMRMRQDEGRTAADIVNTASVEELQRLFVEYGEEPMARRAAQAIVRRREQKPFERTLDLADTLASSLPQRGKIHPATRVFQALRIEVNDELGALKDLLEQAPRCLKPGGRLVLLSFHSLEDRIIKHTLQHKAAEWMDRPEWPEPRRNPDYCFRLLSKKPIEASPAEIAQNPRSRSARLRGAERITP
jgi:16S rRNA (cytosine1402-N4)-methyltransferase